MRAPGGYEDLGMAKDLADRLADYHQATFVVLVADDHRFYVVRQEGVNWGPWVSMDAVYTTELGQLVAWPPLAVGK